MLIDVTLKIDVNMMSDAQKNEKKALVGHLGTHFDVMDKEFPLAYIERDCVIFDVSNVKNRDINLGDIDFKEIKEGMFVGFYSGFIEDVGYGNATYFQKHPQLSNEIINELVAMKVSIIGIDFAGVRRGKEHTITDQYCADHDVFIVENMCNLSNVLNYKKLEKCIMNTYPMHYLGMSGLPCRVIAKMDIPKK